MKTACFSILIVVLAFSFRGKLAAQESMMTEKAPPSESTAPSASPAIAAAPSPPAKAMSRTEEILKRFDKNGDGRLDEDEKADAHEMMLEEQMAKGEPLGLARALGTFQALGLELFDRNRDNRIDDTERLDALAFVQQGDSALKEVLLKHFDKNADGKLDEIERRESYVYTEEHRGELMLELLLKRYDANANGQLDPAEKTAIREAWSKMPPAEAERAGIQKLVQEEWSWFTVAWLRKRFDANENGRLDPDEQKAAQAYAQEHRTEIAREVLLKRFDENGDGLLDETEWARLREAIGAAPLKPASPATPAAPTPNEP